MNCPACDPCKDRLNILPDYASNFQSFWAENRINTYSQSLPSLLPPAMPPVGGLILGVGANLNRNPDAINRVELVSIHLIG